MGREFPLVKVTPDLIRAAGSGDRVSLEALLEAAWPHAFRIAKSILRDDAAAEDAAQEACATVICSIGSLRKPESFRSWLYRLVVRQALADLNQRQHLGCAQPEISNPIDSHVLQMDVRTALFQLPVRLRIPLILHHYAGLNSKEIGQIVGVPSATVRFQLAQARRRMQRFLRDGSAHSTHNPREAIR